MKGYQYMKKSIGSQNNEVPVYLPPKFRCIVDGKMEPKTKFSNKQLLKWYARKRRANDGVNEHNIGLTCRIHSGEPPEELKCNGPCTLFKSRNKFSHSQRRNKLRWCEACIRWKDQQDYDTIPNAAPNGFVAPDEEQFEGATDGFHEVAFEDDPDQSEDDEDDATDNEDDLGGPQLRKETKDWYDSSESDNDDAVIRVGDYQGPPTVSGEDENHGALSNVEDDLSALSITSGDNGNGRHRSEASTVSRMTPRGAEGMAPSSTKEDRETWVPPHLRRSAAAAMAKSKGPAVYHNSYASAASVPSHTRGSGPQDRSGPATPTVMSSDSRSGIMSLETGTSRANAGQEWTTVAGRGKKRFNAFNPAGDMESRTADTASQTGTAATSSRGTEIPRRMPKPPGKSGWAKPDNRKQFVQKRDFVANNDDRIPTREEGSDDEF